MFVKVRSCLLGALESRVGQLCVESGSVLKMVSGTLRNDGTYACNLAFADAVGGEKAFSVEKLVAGELADVEVAAPVAEEVASEVAEEAPAVQEVAAPVAEEVVAQVAEPLAQPESPADPAAE